MPIFYEDVDPVYAPEIEDPDPIGCNGYFIAFLALVIALLALAAWVHFHPVTS